MSINKIVEELDKKILFEDFVNTVDEYMNVKNEVQRERNYIHRNRCMEQIINMSKEEFIQKLLTNKLPDFIRADVQDKDYIKLYRDTNSLAGPDYAYNHRERLRTINSIEYKRFPNCFPEKRNYI